MEGPGCGQTRKQPFFIEIRTADFCVRLLTMKRPRVELSGNRSFSHAVLSQDQDRTVAFRNVCYCRTYLFSRDEWTRFEHQVRDHSLLTAKGSTRTFPVAMRFPNRGRTQLQIFSLQILLHRRVLEMMVPDISSPYQVRWVLDTDFPMGG